MKNLLFLMFAAFIFSSCSKTDVELPLADQAIGNYLGSSKNIGGTFIKCLYETAQQPYLYLLQLQWF